LSDVSRWLRPALALHDLVMIVPDSSM